MCLFFFFFQAEDGIRDRDVTGVQTCALPILIKAARGEYDLDAIGNELSERDFDFEEWEILYRLLLQVRLRVSATGTDALETATEPKPALRERVATAVRVLAGQSNGH